MTTQKQPTREQELEREIEIIENEGIRILEPNYGLLRRNYIKCELKGIKEGKAQAISETQKKLEDILFKVANRIDALISLSKEDRIWIFNEIKIIKSEVEK